MEKIKGFVIILLCNLAGSAISGLSGLPLPGSVLGLLILLGLLVLKVVKVETVEPASALLTGFMMFFILPGGVNMMNSFAKLEGIVAQVVFIAILSTALCMLAAGYTAQGIAFLKGKGRKGEKA